MSLSVLVNDVEHTCKEMQKSAEDAAKVWGAAKDLYGGLKEGTYTRDLVITKMWECKASIQTIIDTMVQKMSGLHLLVSGALTTMRHNGDREMFLQKVLDPMMQAQMAGTQANGAADMVTQMILDLVKQQDET